MKWILIFSVFLFLHTIAPQYSWSQTQKMLPQKDLGIIVELKTPPLLQRYSKTAQKIKLKRFISKNSTYQSLYDLLKNSDLMKALGSLDADQKEVQEAVEYLKGLLDNQNKMYKGRVNNLISKLRLAKMLSSSRSHQNFAHAFNGFSVPGLSMQEAILQFGKDPEVKRIIPIQAVQANLFDAVEITQATAVWKQTDANRQPVQGKGVKIGIIDTGIDYTHVDLGGCFGAGCKVEGGINLVNPTQLPIDDHGHGTHVASIAAGNGALKGIAPEAKLYALKALDADGGGFSTDILKSIEYCVDPNGDGRFEDQLDICNFSLGAGEGNPDDVMSLAADNAVQAGVIMVVAAGNVSAEQEGLNSTINSPGTSRNAITVGAACKPQDANSSSLCRSPVASFSAHGPVLFKDAQGRIQSFMKPDLVAPGVNICAAKARVLASAAQNAAFASTCDNNHMMLSGTSMATPMVAGAAALLLQANPQLLPKDVKEALQKSSFSLNEAEVVQGKGRLDASSAYRRVADILQPPKEEPPAPKPDTVAPIVQVLNPVSNAVVGGTVMIQVSANDNIGVQKVEFYINGALAQSLTGAPYQMQWNTIGMNNGSVKLQAKAYDKAGNVGLSSEIRVQVLNDKAPPKISSVNVSMKSVNKTIDALKFTASASDDTGIQKVDFNLNGRSGCSANSSPYSCEVQIKKSFFNMHSLTAKATDLVGKTSTSRSYLLLILFGRLLVF